MTWASAPTVIGTGNSKTSGTTFTITTTASVAAGDLIIVCAGGVTATPLFSEMATSPGGVSGGGVTWQGGWSDIANARASSNGGNHYWGVPSSTVASGTTLTITLAATCKAMAGVVMVMSGSPAGITGANVQDVGENGTAATSTGHATASCVTVAANTMQVGVLMYNGAAGTVNEAASDTVVTDTGTSGGSASSNYQIHVGRSTNLALPAGSGTAQYSPSLASSTFGVSGTQCFTTPVVQAPAPPICRAMQAVARAANW